MTYYSVLDVTPTSQDWGPAYVNVSNDLVEKHGGNYIARTNVHERETHQPFESLSNGHLGRLRSIL